MRTLNYKLADGTIVKDYEAAVASGQKFTDYMEEIVPQRGKTTPIREACLALYGVVNTATIAAVKQKMAAGTIPATA